MRGLILYSILTIFSSCSGGLSSVYNFDYPLTEKTVKSNSSLVEVKIPLGWFVAEDNEHNSTDLWLVKDDYSATIKFILISFNDYGSRSTPVNQLEKVVSLTKIMIKTKFGKAFKGFTNEEVIEDGTLRYYAFQYADDKNFPVRTIIFKSDSKYCEVTAYPLAPSNFAEIFNAQNSLLASIK